MKIGLVPMAAKPYHSGHHALVTMAASENDEVLLYISLSDRKRKGELTIRGADMETIWREEIEKILPGNVIPVYGGVPVQQVYQELQKAENLAEKGSLEDIYSVYSDPIDTSKNYPEANRMKYFPLAYTQGNVIFASEENPEALTRGIGTPNVSGTGMRSALQCGDEGAFKSMLPDGLDKDRIYTHLCPLAQNEALLRALIKSIV